MDKEQILLDFLKGLRIVLNNACAYQSNHPYFKTSAEEFKQRLDKLIVFMNPITIGIGNNFLFIENKKLEKDMLYVNLASMFHLRKIKKIEFIPGVTIEELIGFLSSIALPVKEFFKSGGIHNVLIDGKLSHINIEELDYSDLLSESSQEAGDVWIYLFKEAVKNNDSQKAINYAGDFDKIVDKIKANNILKEENLTEVNKFLDYLKHEDKGKFLSCSKNLLQLFLKEKESIRDNDIEKIKLMFSELNKEDLVQVLFDGILSDDNFNYLTFSLFTRLFDTREHKDIAEMLKNKIKTQKELYANPKIRKKVKELFAAHSDSSLPSFYQHALSFILDDSSLEGELFFDKESLEYNYHMILLYLLEQETDAKQLGVISDILYKESIQATKSLGLDYLKSVFEIIENKMAKDKKLDSSLKELQGGLSNYIETLFFEEKQAGLLEYFIGKINKSILGYDFYLEKILKERRINKYSLIAFLKFFPEKLYSFADELKNTANDIDFMMKVVGTIDTCKDNPLFYVFIGKIFPSLPQIIKREIVKSIKESNSSNEEFLFSLTHNDSFIIKKEAVKALIVNKELRRKVAAELLDIPSNWGKNNNLILDNIDIAEEIDLDEAHDYLSILSNRRFFWNRSVKKRASKALSRKI